MPIQTTPAPCHQFGINSDSNSFNTEDGLTAQSSERSPSTYTAAYRQKLNDQQSQRPFISQFAM